MATHRLGWSEELPPECRNGALAIGNFDGVHRGHLALLEELKGQAKQVRGPAVVLTFDPHPLQLLRPEQFKPVLTTLDDRAGLLQAHGADHVIILRTTRELLQRSAAEFFGKVVLSQVGARALVEGGNFAFGRDREGTIEKLRDFCQHAGVGFTIVPSFRTEDGIPVSSSRVRTALETGDVREAARLLGRPYRLRGTVAEGSQRGHKLGFPTANLENIQTLAPLDGVYAVRVHRGKDRWAGAANIGPNPTFGEQARKVEVHVIGFQGNLYGDHLAIDFIARLRDTRTFDGIGELVEQLKLDVREAERRVAGSH